MQMPAEVRTLASDNWANPHPTPGYVWTFRVFLYAALGLAICFGGPITRAAAGFALFFGILADRDGAARHVFRLAGLALAVCFSPALGVPLGNWLGPRLGTPPLVGQGIGIALAGLGIMFAAGVLGRRVAAFVRRLKALRGPDHILGALLGSGEGVLVVAAACWLLTTFGEPLTTLRERLAADGRPLRSGTLAKLESLQTAVRNDPTGRLLTRVNPLPEIPAIQTAQQATELVADEAVFTAVMQDPQVHAFSQLPVIRKHLEALQHDKELRAAINKQDLVAIMQCEVVGNMLNDRELHEAVRTHWGDLKSAMAQVGALKDAGDFEAMARSDFSRAQLEAARQAAQQSRGR
jgi:uncharacterized membrane protein required for colicin V production